MSCTYQRQRYTRSRRIYGSEDVSVLDIRLQTAFFCVVSFLYINLFVSYVHLVLLVVAKEMLNGIFSAHAPDICTFKGLLFEGRAVLHTAFVALCSLLALCRPANAHTHTLVTSGAAG